MGNIPHSSTTRLHNRECETSDDVPSLIPYHVSRNEEVSALRTCLGTHGTYDEVGAFLIRREILDLPISVTFKSYTIHLTEYFLSHRDSRNDSRRNILEQNLSLTLKGVATLTSIILAVVGGDDSDGMRSAVNDHNNSPYWH